MKKPSTQVIEWLKSLQEGPDGNVSGPVPFAKITWAIGTLEPIDQRDEQKQKPRKKHRKPAKARR